MVKHRTARSPLKIQTPREKKPPSSVPDRTFRRTPVLVTLAITLSLMAVQLLLFRPYYAYNDDTFKVFFTQGVGTDLAPSAFMGYSNPLWGLLFKGLFTFFPRVPWYGLAMVGVQALSVFALFYAVQWTPAPRRKTLFLVLAFFAFFSSFFSTIQFTVTSSLAAQAGLFLFAALWQSGSIGRNGAASFLAALLILLSSLIRFDALALTLWAALPFIGWMAVSQGGRWKGLERKGLWAGTALLVLAGVAFNSAWYRQNQAWTEFARFDHERVELQDYRFDPYNGDTKHYFDQAGWSRNDLDLLKGWYFMDKDTFDAGRMAELARHFPRVYAEGKPSSFDSVGEIAASIPVQTALAFFLCFLLFCPHRSLPFFLLQALWVSLVLLFMLYVYRAPERVVFPLMGLLVNAAIYGVGPPVRKSFLPLVGAVFLAICTASAGIAYYRLHVAQVQVRQMESRLNEDLRLLDPKDDQLYVVWDSSFPFENLNAFDNFDVFRKMHLFTLAVYQRCPNAQKMLDHFGIKDLFLDMVDKPNIYLICNPTESVMYTRYMWEHHHRTVGAERVFGCPSFWVFRIHSMPAGRGRSTLPTGLVKGS